MAFEDIPHKKKLLNPLGNMFQIIRKRPGQLDMTFEYIPYEKLVKSLRKYASNL